MKRVLIISYYWPPTGGSGVQRWVKFAKYLPQEGWQPVIYTPENPEAITTDTSLEAEIPAEAEVIQRKILEPYDLYRKLTGKGGKGGGQEVNPINAGKKTFGQKVSMWIRGNLFIPDPRCLWIGPSVRYLTEYIKEHPVDIIVSTGPPHSMHLIARKVAKRTGLPWVADFRDPWTRMFYFKHLALGKAAEKRHRKLEQQVLDEATAVVAVSPLVKDEFESMTSTPVELITNGFDECDFSEIPDSQTDGGGEAENGLFVVTHTGLFAADGDPEMLWEVLAAKCRADRDFENALRIRLAGKTDKEIIDSIVRAGLGDHLADLGYRPHQDAVKEQRNASLLILPLRKEPEYRATLPGKLFEYLASGRPVLGIGQSDGAMARIINETKAGFVFDWEDWESIAKCIEICWERHKDGRLRADTENIGQFSRRVLTRRMAELLDRLTSSPSES